VGIGNQWSKSTDMEKGGHGQETVAEIFKQDIIEICIKNLARYKCVKEVKFVDALPRNAVGKILKNVLKQEFN